MRATIGYHTRKDGNNSVKLTGGIFGGAIDMDTVERLVRHHFTVAIKPSGRPIFVDRDNREVTLYITVDPEVTTAGQAALAEHRKQQRIADAKREAEEAPLRDELAELLEGMSPAEALQRLRGS